MRKGDGEDTGMCEMKGPGERVRDCRVWGIATVLWGCCGQIL